jgi:hypothetical protein
VRIQHGSHRPFPGLDCLLSVPSQFVPIQYSVSSSSERSGGGLF